jgi:hypothetical protein
MIKRFLILLGLFVGFATPLHAFAALDPYAGVDCGKASDTTVCKTKAAGGADPIAGPNGVLKTATNIISFVAGLAAVIFMVVAGIKYITSNGEPAEISKAKQTLIFAAVGLFVIIAARAIIGFVINKV